MTAPEFDPNEVAFDANAHTAARAAVLRGQQAHQALLDAADVLATLAAATIGDTGAADGSTSQPPRPTAQQRVDEQIAKRFGPGRTQPPTDGRPPTAKTGQAAKQLARRFPSREES